MTEKELIDLLTELAVCVYENLGPDDLRNLGSRKAREAFRWLDKILFGTDRTIDEIRWAPDKLPERERNIIALAECLLDGPLSERYLRDDRLCRAMCEAVYYLDRIEPEIGPVDHEELNGLAFGLVSAKEWLTWRERRRAENKTGTMAGTT
jgi:hypothetical protein